MKAKGFKVSTIILAIGAVFLALFGVSIPTQTVAAASSSDAKSSYWMLTGNGQEKTGVNAGTTYGYSKYVLNAENVTLETVANDGFDVLEWRVEYNDGVADKVLTLSPTSASETITVFDSVNSSTATLTANFEDLDGDNLYDESSLTFSKVFANVEVEPVFDYTYYNLNVTDLVDNADVTIIDGITGYVETAGEVATKVNNVYLKLDEEIYLFKEAYNVGTSYYVLHNGKKADVATGSYKAGEVVEFNLNTATDSTIQAKNVNLTSQQGNTALTVNTDSSVTNVEALANNSVKFINNSYTLTESMFGKVVIETSIDLENSLALEYHNVYKVQLAFNLDGVAATSDLVDLLINGSDDSNGVITVDNYVAKINETEYYVKSAKDNQYNRTFAVSATDYNEKEDGKLYCYYVYNNMINGASESNSNRNTYASFTGNTTITINYSSKQYDITFKFAVLDSNKLLEAAGNVHDSISLVRGESEILSGAGVANVGYTFVGYADNLTTPVGDITKDNKEITISENTPENVTVFMVYEKARYTLKLSNYNQISLTSGNVYYPLKNLTISINGENAATFNGLTGTSTTLAEGLRVDDSIKLTTQITDGFKLNGYYLTNNAGVLTDELTGGELTLTSNVISTYAKDESGVMVIEIFADEEYNEDYKITYFIDKSDDATVTKGVMADLSVVFTQRPNTETQITVEYVDINGNVTATKEAAVAAIQQIVVSKIRKFDLVTLKSTSFIENQGSANECDYAFIMFTKDGTSALSSSVSGQEYSYTETVVLSRSIEVVYSHQESELTILFETTNAAGFNGTLTVVGADKKDATSTDLLYVLTRNQTVEISFGVTKGYVFTNLDHAGNGLNASAELTKNTDETIITYEFVVETDKTQTIVINFSAVQYNLVITQKGGGVDGQVITKPISANNLEVEFDKPEGYYVENFMVLAGTIEVDYSLVSSNVKETNDNITSKYSYEFSKEEFLTLVDEYAVLVEGTVEQININVYYTKYLLSVTIAKKLSNPKTETDLTTIDKLPTFELEYNDGTTPVVKGVDEYLNTIYSVKFNNIPYGATVDYIANGYLPLGFEFVAWTDSGNNVIDSVQTRISAGTIKENKNVNFVFKYTEYTIYTDIATGTEQGSPVVQVNNKNSNVITLKDKLEIRTNPDRNGYKFKSIVYTKLTEYTYSSDWATLWNNLYVVGNGKYVKNTVDQYSSANTYYKQEQVVITDNAVYAPQQNFHISNYFADENNQIKFEIHYTLREITINNTAAKFNGQSLGVAINPEDYATYTVTATGDKGERPITATAKADKSDGVTIVVNIKNSIKYGVDQTEFNLTQGITLKEVTLAETRLSADQILAGDTEGSYIITFSMSDWMANIPDDDQLNIVYKFGVSSKTLRVKTNITSSVLNDHISLEIVQQDGQESDSTSGIVSASDEFLSKSSFKVEISALDNYDKYIRIYDIQAYRVKLVNGEEQRTPIDEADYKLYGIYLPEDATVISTIEVRHIDNIEIVLNVSPVIYFEGKEIVNNSHDFEPTIFKADKNGVPVVQTLTKGYLMSDDISAEPSIADAMVISYKNHTTKEFVLGDGPSLAGEYDVVITFKTTGTDFAWLEEANIRKAIEAYDLRYIIEKKDITITYKEDQVTTLTKEYSGSSELLLTDWLNYLVYTDNQSGGLSVSYATAIQNKMFVLAPNARAFVTNKQDKETADANELSNYNVTIAGLALSESSSFCKNYNLITDTVVIRDRIKILPRTLKVKGIEVYDKVFDGTTNAVINFESDLTLENFVKGETLTINKELLKATFDSEEIGKDKVVFVDAGLALETSDENTNINNYKVKLIEVQNKVIYPYSLTVKLDEDLEATIYNNAGLTDYTKVDLIPLNAKLNVDYIRPDSSAYANIYSKVSKYMSRTNAFKIGYKFFLEVNGVRQDLDCNLHVAVPKIKSLTKVIYLSGDKAGYADYEKQEDYILIDLSKAEGNVGAVLLTQKRALLELWQIILIVVASVLLVAAIVVVFIVIRKKKSKGYSKHDKI